VRLIYEPSELNLLIEPAFPICAHNVPI
jgi:hypothetical protein